MSKSFTPEYSCYFLGGAYLLSSRIAFGDVSYRLIVSRALSWMYRSGPPLVDCDSYPATFVYTSTAVVQFEPGKQRYTSISIFYSRPQHYSGSYGDFYDMIHLNSLHCNAPVQWRALVIPIVIRLMQAPHGWLNLGEGQDTHTHIYIYIHVCISMSIYLSIYLSIYIYMYTYMCSMTTNDTQAKWHLTI